jgi:hypothetical protein
LTAPRPPSTTRHCLIPFGILALVLLGSGASADHDARDFSGNWQFVGGRTEKREVRAAIDASVKDMTVVLRGLARDRLLKGSKIPKRVSIESSEREIAIRDGDRMRLASPPGRITQTVSFTGDHIELLYEVHDDTLVQYRTTSQGGRRSTYQMDASGERLRVEVVTSSHYLPSPVTYRLTYERIGGVASTQLAD